MKNIVLSAIILVGAFGASEGRADSIFGQTRPTKGYGKRDRDFPVSSETLSPSQMHEVYGSRVDLGVDVTDSRSKDSGEKVRSTNPGATLRGFVGGDNVVLGLGVSRNEFSSRENSEVAQKERVINSKVVPALALTFSDHVTAGVASELNWTTIKQNSDLGTSENSLQGYTRREALGLSFHTSKMEVGVMHATLSNSRAHGSESDATDEGGFAMGLVSQESLGQRDLYTPASNSLFVRGNLTKNFSLQGAATHVEYDANVDGAKETFTDYNRADRIAGQIQGVYWFDDLASRVSMTGLYRGATYAPFGTEENSLGYRDSNLYGGAIDGMAGIGHNGYVGLRLAMLRGERDQDLEAGRIVARETRTTVGTTFSKSF